MKTFYKINTNGAVSVGSGTVIPQGFTEYTVGSEPQALLDAKALEAKKAFNQDIYNQISVLESKLLRATRELLSTTTTVTAKGFAQTKIDNTEAQIEALRAQIKV